MVVFLPRSFEWRRKVPGASIEQQPHRCLSLPEVLGRRQCRSVVLRVIAGRVVSTFRGRARDLLRLERRPVGIAGTRKPQPLPCPCRFSPRPKSKQHRGTRDVSRYLRHPRPPNSLRRSGESKLLTSEIDQFGQVLPRPRTELLERGTLPCCCVPGQSRSNTV